MLKTLFPIEVRMLKREVWVEKVVPSLILFSLWLDGWFFPVILIPIFYVLMVEKKDLGWFGFSRCKLWFSLVTSLLIVLVLTGTYYPVFLYYLPLMKEETIDVYTIFLDIVWYPIYEEVTYRSFALTHFAELNASNLSTRNLAVNLSQSLLFLSVHKHHFSVPLVLIPVFLLGLLNGALFLRTRNVYGCIVSHSALNCFSLLLRSPGST